MRSVPTKYSKVLAAIQLAGGRAFFVGGCVRDSHLGIKPNDFDIEIYGLDSERLTEVLKPFGAATVGSVWGMVAVDFVFVLPLIVCAVVTIVVVVKYCKDNWDN